MDKRRILLITTVLLCMVCTSRAEEAKLGVTFDVTYVSRYLFRGIDTYPEGHSAIQPSIDVDLYGTGFGFNIWASRANGSGFEDTEEIDYTLYYGNSLFEGETYATDYQIGWVYYNYPDNPRKASDLQELFAVFSLPNICPGGIVPSYTIISTWPAKSHSTGVSESAGWIHVFGLGYDWTLPDVGLGIPEQVLSLSADFVYNDGAYGEAIDHDWSHAVFGVSTSFDLGNNLTFTPGVYYQASMDDSVNDDDETWVSLSMAYSF